MVECGNACIHVGVFTVQKYNTRSGEGITFPEFSPDHTADEGGTDDKLSLEISDDEERTGHPPS